MARAVAHERIAFARTVCLMGDPIGAGGITMHDDIGETWALFSPLVLQFPKALFKACKAGIAGAVEKFNPQVILSFVHKDDLTAQRFIERLGYKQSDQRLYVYGQQEGDWWASANGRAH
jgi:hypothetical protein